MSNEQGVVIRFQPYPAVRYRRNPDAEDGVDARIVKTAAEDDALDASVWKKRPLDCHAAPEPIVPDVPAETVPEIDAAEDARRKALHSMSVKDVVDIVEKASDLAALERVRDREQANPKGARKGILAAIEAQIAKLAG